MSKQKRSRALLRNLRKQARQGTLSAREKQQLASQEKKFRKARKSTAKGVGAGLAGAAALLSTTAGQQLMSGAKDFMGRASDRRMKSKVERADERSKKEAEKLEELARQREEETGVRMAEGADREEEAERQEREGVTKPVTDVDFGMGPEGPTRDDFDAYRRQRAEELGSQVDTPRVLDYEGDQETIPGKRRGRLPIEEEGLGFSGQLPDLDDDAAIERYKLMRDAESNQMDRLTGGFKTTGQKPEGSPAFERAQRILAGELTGDSRVDLGFDIEDQPEEQDFPNEFFPLDQVYESRERSRRERPGFNPDDKGPMGDGGKVEYGIGGAILGGINALRSGQGLGGAALAAGKGFVTPGSGIAQGAKLAGGLLAGSQNPALAKFGQIAQVGSSFLPGGGGAMGALGALPGLLSGEQGMKVQEMRQGGRAADLKKMIAKKYGFR